MKEIKINKDAVRRQLEARAGEERQKRKEAEVRSMEAACKELENLIGDPRYKGYKSLLETRIALRKEQREQLKDMVKSSDEYIRLGIAYDAEIQTLKEILEIPKQFAERMKELNNG